MMRKKPLCLVCSSVIAIGFVEAIFKKKKGLLGVRIVHDQPNNSQKGSSDSPFLILLLQ
jgi:hypothetical protein